MRLASFSASGCFVAFIVFGQFIKEPDSLELRPKQDRFKNILSTDFISAGELFAQDNSGNSMIIDVPIRFQTRRRR